MIQIPRPLTRDALDKLIADRNYWNPNDPDYEARQRLVRGGFQQLYPGPLNAGGMDILPQQAANEAGNPPDWTHEETPKEHMENLRERLENLMDEKQSYSDRYPNPLERPIEIEDRIRQLDREIGTVDDEIQRLSPTLHF